jgi:hypothetical protein
VSKKITSHAFQYRKDIRIGDAFEDAIMTYNIRFTNAIEQSWSFEEDAIRHVATGRGTPSEPRCGVCGVLSLSWYPPCAEDIDAFGLSQFEEHKKKRVGRNLGEVECFLNFDAKIWVSPVVEVSRISNLLP